MSFCNRREPVESLVESRELYFVAEKHPLIAVNKICILNTISINLSWTIDSLSHSLGFETNRYTLHSSRGWYTP